MGLELDLGCLNTCACMWHVKSYKHSITCTLGHFFECYRDGLADYVPNPAAVNPIQPHSARVAPPILFGRYNRETRYRV